MDIYTRLKQDHRRQRELAAQLADTSGDSADRQQLWQQFRAELESHANAEEQSLYAALIERPEAQEKAQHSIAEHKEASDLIKELDDIDMSSPAWLQKFKQLQDEVEHHLDEEEAEVFPLASQLFDSSLAEHLGAKFDERKAAECA